jgi:hypothetical protein
VGPIQDAVIGSGFDTATPLWYYILREADVQRNGNRLSSVSSRIVAETLKRPRLSGARELYQQPATPVKPSGIDVGGGTIIATVADLLKFSGAPL